MPQLQKYDSVGITTTIQHAHQTKAICSWLNERGVNAVIGAGSREPPRRSGSWMYLCFIKECKRRSISVHRDRGFHAIGVSLATKKPTFSLDPFSDGILQEVSADRLLRKRFAQIEKAKQAKTFGILLSSKSGQARRELAERLAALNENAVIILIREISEMQLRNLGFDAYVNTACPRLALDDQSRFPMPVLSPAEFEIVLGKRSWDDYVIDEILP